MASTTDPLRVIKIGHFDDLVLSVSSKTIKARGLDGETFVWAHHRDIRRPFLLNQDDNICKDVVCISQTAVDNLAAASTDIINFIYLSRGHIPKVGLSRKWISVLTLRQADFVTLYLVGDPDGLSGSLMSDYLHPYFSSGDCMRPMHVDDFITIHRGTYTATFAVLDIGPLHYGIITPDTYLSLIPPLGKSILVEDVETNNPLHCAQELLTKIDYINSKDYASSIAQFVRCLQRLVYLLEPPPVYESCCGVEP